VTKERKAQVITVLVLAAGLGAALYRKGTFDKISFSAAMATQPKAEPSPQDTIYAMLDAARDGNVDKFLATYAGDLQSSLRQSVTPQYRKDMNAPIKGVALNEPAPLNEREVKVRVEYVYQDRNEAQIFYLEKVRGEWKITRVENAERVKTLIPYGTPVQ
jgi:hypothetical protein